MKTFLAYTTFAVIATVTVYAAITYSASATPTSTVTPVEPGCTTFECIVELRTKEVYERDQLKYLEQARLTALQELNIEAQDMVYVSPYVTTPN